MNTPDRIGIELKLSRVRANMTLVQVAQAVGISEAHMSRIENGKSPASDALVARIKAVTHWTPSISFIVDEAETVCERTN